MSRALPAVLLVCLAASPGQPGTRGDHVEYHTMETWVSSADGSAMCSPGPAVALTRVRGKPGTDWLTVDPSARQQPIRGFGATFTDSDIYHFMRMSPARREEALRALFDPATGAGWNLMRIGFGSTDWERNWEFYTYDDMPPGQTDPELSRFSIQEDIRRGHIQVIRQAMAINPDLRIFAAVWGPPAWMKDNDKLISDGVIPPERYEVYARYLCACVKAYEAQGIPILSVSPQNEPLCNDGRKTPQALWMEPGPMAKLVQVIHGEFARQGVASEVWVHDHNWNNLETWVRPILADTQALAAIDGVAWHDYAGDCSYLPALLADYPALPMYHTERALYSLKGMSRLLRILAAGCRSHNHWVTIADEYGGPHQFGGGSEKNKWPLKDENLPALCAPRADADQWRLCAGYHLFGQVTRFVCRDAVCVASTCDLKGLTQVAFVNPDSSLVVIAANAGDSAIAASVAVGRLRAPLTVPAQSVVTGRLRQ